VPCPSTGGRVRCGLTTLCALALATIVLVCADAASAATESVQFTLTGRGWGHGVGMSQYGAYGYARQGWDYRQIITHYYTGVTFGTAANRTIRVLLTDAQASVSLSGTRPVTAQAGSSTEQLPASTPITVTAAGAGLQVKAGDAVHSFTKSVAFSCNGALLQLKNANSNGGAALRYRGTLTVQRSSSGLMVVNSLPLEDYIRGVVPNEVSPSWPAEAVKAQAVAARSFGAQRIGSSGAFDIYCDGRSQCYNGASREAAGSDAAVAATQGVIPVYKGKPIIASFFSSSGGHTENSENVWNGSPVPYLRGVPDPYDTAAPDHIWRANPIRLSGAAVAARLGSGRLTTLYVAKRGASPRVVTAYAVGAKGTTSLTGNELRMKLGLRSSWVTIRSLSIGRSGSGGRLVLSGRTFPALPAGARLELRVKASGRTTVVPVPQTGRAAVSLKLPNGQRARGTRYSVTVKPTGTAVYTFAYSGSLSPAITVKSKPRLAIAVPADLVAGRRALVNGSVTPGTLAGCKVSLQVKATDWMAVGSGKIGRNGVAVVPWTPAAAGSFRLRMKAAAGGGNDTLVSQTVTAKVAAQEVTPSASPSLTPSPPPAALSRRLSARLK